MAQINSYLTFNGNCRSAITFYKECLGGELTIQTVEGTPMENRCPEGMKHQIMHSMLISGGMILLASDMIGKEGYIKGNTISLAINCDSENQIETFYKKLSQEGEILDPLKDMFWGATYGCLKDKFGIIWSLNYDKNRV